ncbi:ankyrin repeat and SOCS box protein 3 [Brienomyrus brachyistius]|uniref:ankyrin repeat and SOCS box protein 3 n=1 Tax=Brienomyrus brachyistius TaxID=42636 RepID=UPI0020B3F8D8|nr:ankyrin repeat and SOCS box protein 3 [Brienomyrus brachyistius]XP_048843964.1 ankyrin repeat and SOCS box protein 3 [Brienomyrus brachyistius]
MDFTECYQHTCSAVALAARERNHRLVRRLIQKNYSIDVRDNRGWNALHEAAFGGAHRCAQILLKAARSKSQSRGYVNTLTHDGSTALYLAAEQGHLSLVQSLLQAGADVNRVNNDGASPLFAAVDSGHRKVVELLVREGSEVNSSHSASGWSCLHQATFKGHSEVVSFLVGVAQLDITDDFEITPLFVAAQYGQRRCLELLAEAGADTNHQSHDLATPLLIASQEGHLSCVTALLEYGADPNLYCNEDAWQLPIHAAAQFGHTSILERLLPLTDRACDRQVGKVSPVYSAVLGGQVESLQLLLRAGYSPDAQNCQAFGFPSPLATFQCSQFERASQVHSLVQLLLKAGAHVDGGLYSKCLRLRQHSVLALLLDHTGLPSGGPLEELLACSLEEEQASSALDWLPLLLQAGLQPSLLLHPVLFEKVESDVINFLLEFTNWSLLPPSLLASLYQRRAESTWKPRPHLESMPPLCHLCRLAVRNVVGSQSLASKTFVRRLPVPVLLQDYLNFVDVFGAHDLPKQAEQEGAGSQGQ